MERVKYRKWCTACQSYRLFSRKTLLAKEHQHEYECDYCSSKYEECNEIPFDKILEQRNRYQIAYKRSINEVISTYLTMANNDDLFSSDIKTRIIEDDAGQKQINANAKIAKQKAKAEYELRRTETINYDLKFKNIGRNDLCPCDSGKKFKKCHLSKVEIDQLKYHFTL